MNSPAGAAVAAQIRAAVERALAPTRLEIFDDSAAHAGHAGARAGGHRLVYAAVGPLMSGAVHALNIVARTPAEEA